MTKEQKERILTMINSKQDDMRDLGIIALMTTYRYAEWYTCLPSFSGSIFYQIKKTYRSEKGCIILHTDGTYSIAARHIIAGWGKVFNEYPRIIV